MNQEVVFDALVGGTGISGGWAAKELCGNGIKTLVLERGPMVKHIEDYKTVNDDPWDYPLKGELSLEDLKKQHVQARVGWATKEDVKHLL